MLTVKEFKDLGVEFVVGDSLSENPTPVGKAWAEEINITTDFDSFVVNFFAWRDNTGVTVELDGLIDICFEDGTVSYGEKNICFEWSLHDESFISKWRPSLNQSVEIKYGSSVLDETLDAIEQFNDNTVKPVFTQEMADKGELPPVGAQCLIMYESSGHFYEGSVIAYFEDLIWLDLYGKNPVRMAKEVVFKPIDTRTPKQKAVDEMYKDVFNDEFIDDEIRECDEYLFCVKSIEKGYKKC